MDNNVANIAYNLNGYYDRNLLEASLPKFNYLRFAQYKDIPTNNTDTIKFRRYLLLSDATTPLIEGITPQGSRFQYETLSAQVKQYGDFVLITEWVDWTHEDAVLTEIAKKQGSQAGSSLDSLMGDTLVSGTNVYYAAGVANRGLVNTKLTSGDAREGTRILKNQEAQHITDMIMPSDGYATRAIHASYILFIHPDTTKELKAAALTDNSITLVKDYARPEQALENEVCSIDEFRCLESTKAKKVVGAGAGGKDVYLSVAVAADSYGATRVSGKALQNIRHPFGSAGSSDALNQRGTSGWKATFVGLRLQEAHILRFEHTNA